jgi:hypothetical protein
MRTEQTSTATCQGLHKEALSLSNRDHQDLWLGDQLCKENVIDGSILILHIDNVIFLNQNSLRFHTHKTTLSQVGGTVFSDRSVNVIPNI